MNYLNAMNSYIERLTRLVNHLDTGPTQKHKIYLIPGSHEYRWIIPTYNRKVYQHLKSWRPYSLKAYIFWKVILFFYRMRLIHVLPNIGDVTIVSTSVIKQLAIYIGTPGPCQKLVITDTKNQKIIKIGVGNQSSKKIYYEYKFLQQCKLSGFPSVFEYIDHLGASIQSKSFGSLSSSNFSKDHILLLKKMPQTNVLIKLEDFMPDWQDYKKKYTFIRSIFHYPKIPNDLYFIVQHGDFCPWNILAYRGQYQLIDFEEARNNGLPLYDYLYFHVRQAQLFHGGNQIPLNKRYLLKLHDRIQDIDQLLKLNMAYMIYLAIQNNDIEFARFINKCEFIFK